MFDAIILWLHVLGAVVFIGPQIFLAAIAMPAIRTVEDAKIRQALTSKITRGFGMLGGGALGLLLVTGIYNYYQADDAGALDFKRYFIVLQIKLTLVTLVIILTALHGMVFGRQLQRLQAENATAEAIASARQRSMLTSMATLASSIAILLCAALLGSDWAFQGGLR